MIKKCAASDCNAKAGSRPVAAQTLSGLIYGRLEYGLRTTEVYLLC